MNNIIISKSILERSTKIDDKLHKKSFKKLSIEESKTQRYFDSYYDMIKSLKHSLQTESIKKSIGSIEELDFNKPTKVNVSLISNVILSKCDVAITTGDVRKFYIQNPDTKLMTSSSEFIKQIIVDLSSSQDSQSSVEIHDVTKTTKQVLEKLTLDSTVRSLKLLPNNYIVMHDDTVLDIESHQLLDIDEINSHYDITSKNDISLALNELLTKDEQLNVVMYRQFISRIMKDWSSQDEQVETLLWEVIFSVLQNNNHEKYVVIKGPGGNGKSTFMQLLAKIAGQKYTQYINIHQFGDPNAINRLDFSTKVVIGDDAATNHKISDYALSNLKSIISGQPISLPVKYSENIAIQTNAIFVQGTNTDLNFYENNPAVKSRLVVIPWTTTNYRDNKPSDITFNLDELLDEQLFINTWVTMCIEKIKPFKKYTVPDIIIKTTNEMISSTDTIHQFLNDIICEIDGYDKIPTKPMYESFVKWSKANNPSSGVMKYQTFIKSLDDKSDEFNFISPLKTSRQRFIKYDNILSLCKTLDVEPSSFSGLQRALSFKNVITESELDSFSKRNHPISIDDLTDRERQMLSILIHDKKETHLQSIYGSII